MKRKIREYEGKRQDKNEKRKIDKLKETKLKRLLGIDAFFCQSVKLERENNPCHVTHIEPMRS